MTAPRRPAVDDPVGEHYARLAADYDDTWTYSPEYVARFAAAVADALALSPADVIADVGCGTGLHTRALLDHVAPSTPILCVDPVAAMLDQLPDDERLVPLLARAEDIASGHVALPPEVAGRLSAVVVKEAIHHVADQHRTLAGLAARLAPGGRLLVALLPVELRYPLFPEALRRHRATQPGPDAVVAALRAAGLETEVARPTFDIVLDRDRYLAMVRARYMSVLSTFTDAELAAGAEEIARAHPEPVLHIPDDFLFVVGRRPGPSSP